jgi:hypothetical protein
MSGSALPDGHKPPVDALAEAETQAVRLLLDFHFLASKRHCESCRSKLPRSIAWSFSSGRLPHRAVNPSAIRGPLNGQGVSGLGENVVKPHHDAGGASPQAKTVQKIRWSCFGPAVKTHNPELSVSEAAKVQLAGGGRGIGDSHHLFELQPGTAGPGVSRVPARQGASPRGK